MPDLMDHHVPDASCPSCGHHVDGALAMQEGGEPPKEGDASVCIQCAAIAIYTADLQLRLPAEADWDDTPADVMARLREAQALVRSLPRG